MLNCESILNNLLDGIGGDFGKMLCLLLDCESLINHLLDGTNGDVKNAVQCLKASLVLQKVSKGKYEFERNEPLNPTLTLRVKISLEVANKATYLHTSLLCLHDGVNQHYAFIVEASNLGITNYTNLQSSYMQACQVILNKNPTIDGQYLNLIYT